MCIRDRLRRDEKRWPLLALGMTGVCMSHLLSTLFCAVFCALAAVLSVKKLFAEKRRILAILLAAGVTALCGLWFYVPMMQYTADGISTSVVLNAAENVHVPGSFLVGFAGDAGADAPEDFAYTIGVVPGLALLLGCALLRRGAGRFRPRATNCHCRCWRWARWRWRCVRISSRGRSSVRSESRFPRFSCRCSSRGALSASPRRC